MTAYISYRLINSLANNCDKVPLLAQRNETQMSLLSKLPALLRRLGKLKANVYELPPSRKAKKNVFYYILLCYITYR